jgi:argininosuccinate lyase
VIPSVRLMAGVLENLELKPEALAGALKGGFLTATDMADYLVTKGVPFRTAHSQVGQTVRLAEAQGKELSELTLEEIHQFAPLAESDVFAWLGVEASVSRRRSLGGTATERVAEALVAVEQDLGLLA